MSEPSDRRRSGATPYPVSLSFETCNLQIEASMVERIDVFHCHSIFSDEHELGDCCCWHQGAANGHRRVQARVAE